MDLGLAENDFADMTDWVKYEMRVRLGGRAVNSVALSASYRIVRAPAGCPEVIHCRDIQGVRDSSLPHLLIIGPRPQSPHLPTGHTVRSPGAHRVPSPTANQLYAAGSEHPVRATGRRS